MSLPLDTVPLSAATSAALPPVFLTELVGRADDIERLAAGLRTARLVSLTGPGGTGKTRLAAAVATRVAEETACELGWIDLSHLTTEPLIARHVASALRLREHPGQTAEQALLERIGCSPSLLVLDNCEHVLSACSRFADALLQACPELRILATSREPLGVAGEKTWPVPPLEVPAPGDPAAVSASAIRLFTQRAVDALPSFALTGSSLAAIVRICRRVDGLPLAIELAAARVPVLPPEQLADRLDDTFRVLATRSQVVPSRHRTLRALMDWSYDLLSPGERELFMRLAVFNGGFTLDAADRVAGDTECADVLDLIAALVDKSLLVMREHRGSARYHMLETVRQYAAERLAAAGHDSAARRSLHHAHAQYYAGLVERIAASADTGPAQRAHLDAEHDNVRAALAWTLDHDAPDLALRLCNGMREFWRLRGHFTEGLGWTRRAVDAARGDDRLDGIRARALAAASAHARMMGEYLSFTDWLAEAESLARRVGDRQTLADVLTQLGLSFRDRGDLPAARDRLDQAIDLWRHSADTRGLSAALGARASVALAERDTLLARSMRAEAAALARRAGDAEGEAFALIGLGEVARMEGDLVSARACNQRCLQLFGELGDDWHAAAAWHNLGWIEAQAGNDTASLQAFSSCVNLFRSAGNPFGLTLCLFGYAGLLFRAGEAEAAAVALAAASTHAARVGVQPAAPADVVACEATASGIAGALTADARTRTHSTGSAMALAEALHHAETRLRELLRMPVECDSASPSATPDQVLAAALPAGYPVSRSDAPRAPVGADAAPAVASMRVDALGLLRIFVEDRPLESAVFGSSRPAELLVLLLCHPAGLTREQVGLAFWPEASTSQVKNSFHVLLHRLRRGLGHPEWIVLQGERYLIEPSLCIDFDAVRFEREMRRALDASTDQTDERRLGAALDLFRGEFLEGCSAGDWHLEMRDRLNRLYLAGLLARADALMEAGRIDEAVESYTTVLSRDRLHEEAWRSLMVCHSRAGRRTLALRLYDTITVLLHEELSTSPHPRTTEIYERLQRSESL